jgi:hypothetical protein
MAGERFTIDGTVYDIDTLGPKAQELARALVFVLRHQQELVNQQALLRKARNAYIADLKALLNGAGGMAGESGGKLASAPHTTTPDTRLTDTSPRLTGLLDED